MLMTELACDKRCSCAERIGAVLPTAHFSSLPWTLDMEAVLNALSHVAQVSLSFNQP